MIRQKKALPTKGPLQLDLFEPKRHEFTYRVFGETKSHCQLDYIPVRSWLGNQTYCLAAIMAHNLTRELQMPAQGPNSGTTPKRCNLWGFGTLNTLRQRLVRRAGRFIRAQGRLTLVTSGNATVQNEFAKYLNPSQN